ncbi:MAG TPA: hypothetical protein VE422_03055 [Terriglobia bacterium]|nr:hypothetical protein [Terriglobia bacterium]
MKTILLAICGGLALVTAGCIIHDEPPDYQTMRESRPVGNTTQLSVDLRYDVGTLDIEKASDDSLFSFDLQYDRNRTTPRFDFNEGDHASLRLELDSRSGRSGFGRHDNELTLRLSDKVLLDLDVRTGVSESHLDLSGLALERMQLRGGVGKTDVTFGTTVRDPVKSLEVESGVGELTLRGLGNARVERIDLKGGVGHSELDFSGDNGRTNTDCSIKVGVGAVRLLLPKDADIEIQGNGSFLSNINAPEFQRDGRTYTHSGSNDGARIHIRVESGIGGVTVDLI